MAWVVLLHDDFNAEARGFSAEVREQIASIIDLLERFGPHLKRPHCDTLKGSAHANMKELRFEADGGSPSHSTRNGKRCFWSAATSPAPARRSSTRT